MKIRDLKIIPLFIILMSFLFLGTKRADAITLNTGRSTIQGYVFFDKNQNGVLEYKTEFPGLSGVRVVLVNKNAFIAGATTDARGYYQFYNIKGGTYRVAVILPRHARPTNFTDKIVNLPEHTLTTISFGVIFR